MSASAETASPASPLPADWEAVCLQLLAQALGQPDRVHVAHGPGWFAAAARRSGLVRLEVHLAGLMDPVAHLTAVPDPALRALMPTELPSESP